MTDRIKERLQNPALGYAQRIADAQLQRAGVRLSEDWSRSHWRTEKKPAEEAAPAKVQQTTSGE